MSAMTGDPPPCAVCGRYYCMVQHYAPPAFYQPMYQFKPTEQELRQERIDATARAIYVRKVADWYAEDGDGKVDVSGLIADNADDCYNFAAILEAARARSMEPTP